MARKTKLTDPDQLDLFSFKELYVEIIRDLPDSTKQDIISTIDAGINPSAVLGTEGVDGVGRTNEQSPSGRETHENDSSGIHPSISGDTSENDFGGYEGINSDVSERDAGIGSSIPDGSVKHPVSSVGGTGIQGAEGEIRVGEVSSPSSLESNGVDGGSELSDEDPIIVFVDPYKEPPKPSYWHAPEGFQLPVDISKRAEANNTALALLMDLAQNDRSPNADEKVILAQYTGCNGLTGPAAARFNPATLISRFPHPEIKGSEPWRHSSLYWNSTARSEAISQLTEKHIPEGGNVFLPYCSTPGITGLIDSKVLKKSTLTFHSSDPYAVQIFKLLNKNADARSGKLDASLLLPNFYHMTFMFDTPPVEEWGTKGFSSAIAELSECSVARGVGVWATNPHGLMGSGFSETTVSFRDNVIAYHRQFDLHSDLALQRVGGGGTAQHVLFHTKRTETALTPCPYLERTAPLGNEGLKPVAAAIDGSSSDWPLDIELASRRIPSIVFKPSYRVEKTASVSISDRLKNQPVDSYFINETNDEVYHNLAGEITKITFANAATAARCRSLVQMKDLCLKLVDRETSKNPEVFLQTRQELNEIYDKFRSRFGVISNSENIDLFKNNSDGMILLSLERFDDKTETYKKDEIFNASPLPSVQEVKPKTPQEALRLCFKEYGMVDFAKIGEMLRIPEDVAKGALIDEVFLNPKNEKWEPAWIYLSGNLGEKIRIARSHSLIDPVFENNVKHLSLAMPAPLPIQEITFALNTPWIPEEDIKEFADFTFKCPVNLERLYGSWRLHTSKRLDASAAQKTYGTKERSGIQNFRACLKGTTPTIYIEQEGATRIVDEGASLLAAEKIRQINEAFVGWVHGNPVRSEKLAKIFNETVNCFRSHKPDPSMLTLHGMSPMFNPDPHQLNAVAKGVINPSLMVYHFTGAGKTFVEVAIANERIKLGMNQKIAMVVPNAVLYQTVGEMKRLFPSLNILMVGRKDVTGEALNTTLTRVATARNCFVVTSFECFKDIPQDKNDLVFPMRIELANLQAELESAETKTEQRPILTKIKREEANIETIMNRVQKESPFTFRQLGFDGMMADEAHILRNLKTSGPSGTSTKGADRSEDFLEKANILKNENPNFFIGMSTATMLNRSITEIYNFQRYLQPEVLAAAKIETFHSWLAVFAKTTPMVDVDQLGSIRIKEKYVIANAPELRGMTDLFCDTVMESDVDYIKRPKYENDKPETVTCPRSEAQVDYFENNILSRIEAIREGKVSRKEDNHLKLYTDSLRAGVDLRLIDENATFDPEGKLSIAAGNIVKVLNETSNTKGTQLVFCNSFEAKNEDKSVRFNVFDELKRLIIEKGVPANQVASIYDFSDQKSLTQAYEDFKIGKLRVLMGHRTKLGVGMNLQNKVVADHHIDLPFNPSEHIQACGRARRRGNENDTIRSFIYLTEFSGEAMQASMLANKTRSFENFHKIGRGERTLDDFDETQVNLTELKAEVLGDSRHIDLVVLRNKIDRLKSQAVALSQLDNDTKRSITLKEERIQYLQSGLKSSEKDSETFAVGTKSDEPIIIEGQICADWTQAAAALKEVRKVRAGIGGEVLIGEFYGFKMYHANDPAPTGYSKSFYGMRERVKLRGEREYAVDPEQLTSNDETIRRLHLVVSSLPSEVEAMKLNISSYERDLENQKKDINRVGEIQLEIRGLEKEHALLFHDIEANPPVRNTRKRMGGVTVEVRDLPPNVAKAESIVGSDGIDEKNKTTSTAGSRTDTVVA